MPTTEYVAWTDIMGARSAMSLSLRKSANFVFKLHEIAMAELHDMEAGDIHIYPMMDGFYSVSPTRTQLADFLCKVFRSLANEFVSGNDPRQRFMVRSGIAYGSVIQGYRVPEQAVHSTRIDQKYKETILLGLPMVQAFFAEHEAPPFGIFVDESARLIFPHGSNEHWYRWGNSASVLWSRLHDRLEEHLEWCSVHADELKYKPDRIEIHRDMVNQYFGTCNN